MLLETMQLRRKHPSSDTLAHTHKHAPKTHFKQHSAGTPLHSERTENTYRQEMVAYINTDTQSRLRVRECEAGGKLSVTS